MGQPSDAALDGFDCLSYPLIGLPPVSGFFAESNFFLEISAKPLTAPIPSVLVYIKERRCRKGAMTVTAKRYGLLDALRGLTLVSMVLYHATWDLLNLFGVNWAWFHGPVAFLWQQSICWTFIFLSGFCVSMGRRTVGRGMQVLLAGGLVSAATLLFMPEAPILFGVLTLLGTCMLLVVPLERALNRIPAAVGLPTSALLFVLTRNINDGFFGFGTWNIAPLPEALYRNDFTAFLGFPPADFYSTDYFSLFPWCFLFLTGLFAFRLCRERNALARLTFQRMAPLRLLGRCALPIYLLHQPLLYGCFFLLFLKT